ncbi:hypothetical protein U9M48_041015 [Paspalum notatum var. saurae]|uniref:Uncharacterized protein n=1 Tax=Paspalum notatum var. saurae TaxID=547442 RepID=A0AAQ3USA3_PASNO
MPNMPLRQSCQEQQLWRLCTACGIGMSFSSSLLQLSDARPQTVLVENPKTLDEKGKLVSNVAVGVTSWKR